MIKKLAAVLAVTIIAVLGFAAPAHADSWYDSCDQWGGDVCLYDTESSQNPEEWSFLAIPSEQLNPDGCNGLDSEFQNVFEAWVSEIAPGYEIRFWQYDDCTGDQYGLWSDWHHGEMWPASSVHVGGFEMRPKP